MQGTLEMHTSAPRSCTNSKFQVGRFWRSPSRLAVRRLVRHTWRRTRRNLKSGRCEVGAAETRIEKQRDPVLLRRRVQV